MSAMNGLDDTRDQSGLGRYVRQTALAGFGDAAQERLAAARVLVLGAGGLGSPTLLYLAACGVGTLGIVDDDVVEEHNLARQLIHATSAVGMTKVASAAQTLERVNPDVEVVQHRIRLDAGNARSVVTAYDVVVDCADNFEARYAVSLAAQQAGVPHVWGAALGYDGRVSVWSPPDGPCLSCVFPLRPGPGVIPTCVEVGVFGPVCGAVGSMQAAETVKIVTGVGEPMVGRLALFDARRGSWQIIPVRRHPQCPQCPQCHQRHASHSRGSGEE